MIMVHDVVASTDLDKIFKVAHIEGDIAYGFNIANNGQFVGVYLNYLIPVNHNQKVIQYLLNMNSNKFEIGNLIVQEKPKKKTKKISELFGLSIRQLMRFKNNLKTTVVCQSSGKNHE